MQCFNHPDNAAVGICKHCQRGVCRECASDLGHGIACKGAHEDAVSLLNDLISANAQIQTVNPKTIWVAPLFYLFMGLLFMGWGLSTRRHSMFFATFGGGFIVFAALTYLVGHKAYVKSRSYF